MHHKQQIIVSLTSFPAAIPYAVQAIRSLLNGSVLPDKIVLYLDTPQFPDGVLPPELEALKAESKRLAARARTAESRIGFLKGRYAAIMHDHGLKKVEGKSYTISTRASTSVVVPEDISQLDDLFLRRKETVEADKTVIKEHLERGMSIPGCALKTTISLQIR